MKYVIEKLPDLLSYSAVDPHSPVYGKEFISRKANIPVLNTAIKRGKRAMVAGMGIILKRELDRGNALNIDYSETKIDMDDFRDCVSPTLIVETQGFQAAQLGNFKFLQIFVIVAFFISLYALIFEIVWFHWEWN